MRKSLILVGLTFLSSFATASDIEEVTVTARRLSMDLLHTSQLELQKEFNKELKMMLSVAQPAIPPFNVKFSLTEGWVEHTERTEERASKPSLFYCLDITSEMKR